MWGDGTITSSIPQGSYYYCDSDTIPQNHSLVICFLQPKIRSLVQGLGLL